MEKTPAAPQYETKSDQTEGRHQIVEQLACELTRAGLLGGHLDLIAMCAAQFDGVLQ